MKEEYKEELINKKRYLEEKNVEIQLETEKIQKNGKNINGKVDSSIETHMDDIGKVKMQIDDLERVAMTKDKEIQMREEFIAQQESTVKDIRDQMRDLDNDMDFIEISYQMQKDKADKNETEKEKLMAFFEKLKHLVN